MSPIFIMAIKIAVAKSMWKVDFPHTPIVYSHGDLFIAYGGTLIKVQMMMMNNDDLFPPGNYGFNCSGKVIWQGPGSEPEFTQCPSCKGTGSEDNSPCETRVCTDCLGTGLNHIR